jgi:hypothetical protein
MTVSKRLALQGRARDFDSRCSPPLPRTCGGFAAAASLGAANARRARSTAVALAWRADGWALGRVVLVCRHHDANVTIEVGVTNRRFVLARRLNPCNCVPSKK